MKLILINANVDSFCFNSAKYVHVCHSSGRTGWRVVGGGCEGYLTSGPRPWLEINTAVVRYLGPGEGGPGPRRGLRPARGAALDTRPSPTHPPTHRNTNTTDILPNLLSTSTYIHTYIHTIEARIFSIGSIDMHTSFEYVSILSFFNSVDITTCGFEMVIQYMRRINFDRI